MVCPAPSSSLPAPRPPPPHRRCHHQSGQRGPSGSLGPSRRQVGGLETQQKVRTRESRTLAPGLRLLRAGGGGGNPEKAGGWGGTRRGVNTGLDWTVRPLQAPDWVLEKGCRVGAGGRRLSLAAQWPLCSGRKLLRWPRQCPHWPSASSQPWPPQGFLPPSLPTGTCLYFLSHPHSGLSPRDLGTRTQALTLRSSPLCPPRAE